MMAYAKHILKSKTISGFVRFERGK